MEVKKKINLKKVIAEYSEKNTNRLGLEKEINSLKTTIKEEMNKKELTSVISGDVEAVLSQYETKTLNQEKLIDILSNMENLPKGILYEEVRVDLDKLEWALKHKKIKPKLLAGAQSTKVIQVLNIRKIKNAK